MFKHDLELRQIADQFRQRPFNEHSLTVKDIDMRVCDFAVDQQWHADPRHMLQRGHDVGYVRNAMRASGGGVRGV